MKTPPASGQHVAYLCTTFPVASETFLQREVRALKELGVPLHIYSLFGGDAAFEGLSIRRFPLWKLFSLCWRLPVLSLTRPREMAELLQTLLDRCDRSTRLNFWENLLGLGFAVCMRRHFQRENYAVLHAVWASAPATAAWALSRLTGVPFSFGAHAYDLFEAGGDALLDVKIAETRFVHTSTEAGSRRLQALECPAGKIALIRRGLDRFPPMSREPREPEGALQLLAVGRLVEKKGYFRMLEAVQRLQAMGTPCRLTIIGAGPLRAALEDFVQQRGLIETVHFAGAQPYEAVVEAMGSADLFLFTGHVARSGDRDGFPNVIGEAMAVGVPVAATPVGAVSEGIHDHETGILLYGEPLDWAREIAALWSDIGLRRLLRQNARKWVETHFDAHQNATRLWELLRG